jgi:hypothetical protein
MGHDLLNRSITATRDTLDNRLETAIGYHPTMTNPRGHYPSTDTFLASSSRHLAAVNAVLVPTVRHRLPDGSRGAHEFTRQCRHLEAALALIKAKLYGSAYAVSTPWTEIWADVRREFDRTMAMEHDLVSSLTEQLDDEQTDQLVDRLYRAEQKAPTRPHPYVPHLGMSGRVARRVCRQVDSFWDTAEGRMIPEPIRVHDRDHQGRLTQYLLADPHLEDEDLA